MASYFRWMRGGRKDDVLYQKPRSRSLDARALERSGVRMLLNNSESFAAGRLLRLLSARALSPAQLPPTRRAAGSVAEGAVNLSGRDQASAESRNTRRTRWDKLQLHRYRWLLLQFPERVAGQSGKAANSPHFRVRQFLEERRCAAGRTERQRSYISSSQLKLQSVGMPKRHVWLARVLGPQRESAAPPRAGARRPRHEVAVSSLRRSRARARGAARRGSATVAAAVALADARTRPAHG
ncbi:Protein TolB [Gryllus bimaculatus]|nr:Protein TolB [Gryllus bimaculatus]